MQEITEDLISVRDTTEEKREQKQARNEEIKIQKPGVSGRKIKMKQSSSAEFRGKVSPAEHPTSQQRKTTKEGLPSKDTSVSYISTNHFTGPNREQFNPDLSVAPFTLNGPHWF